MEEKPKEGSCNECGRKVSKDNDFEWVDLKGIGDNFWYPCCQYCRANRTKLLRKYK